MKEFDEYMVKNPRKDFQDEEMKKFLEFAKKRYNPYNQINWTSFDNEEERDYEVKSYLSDSMEALLLFKEFQEGTKK